MANNNDINITLADLRARVDFLAKYILIMGGGSIVLSLNFYISKKKELQHIACFLKSSWCFLLVSIVLFAATLGLIILQAFFSTEYYRKMIESDISVISHPKRYLDYWAASLGALGLIAFIVGIIYLVLAAFSI